MTTKEKKKKKRDICSFIACWNWLELLIFFKFWLVNVSRLAENRIFFLQVVKWDDAWFCYLNFKTSHSHMPKRAYTLFPIPNPTLITTGIFFFFFLCGAYVIFKGGRALVNKIVFHDTLNNFQRLDHRNSSVWKFLMFAFENISYPSLNIFCITHYPPNRPNTIFYW